MQHRRGADAPGPQVARGVARAGAGCWFRPYRPAAEALTRRPSESAVSPAKGSQPDRKAITQGGYRRPACRPPAESDRSAAALEGARTLALALHLAHQTALLNLLPADLL